MAGLPMELRESKDPSKPLQLVTFCYKHCTPKPEKAGACDVGVAAAGLFFETACLLS